MDRDTIMEQLEPHEYILLTRLHKTASNAVNDVVDKWVEAHGILDALYSEHSDIGERKVLNLLIQAGLKSRDEELRRIDLCIMRIDSLLKYAPEPSDENLEDDEEEKEETAEQQGETSLQMWARLRPTLLDEEQLNNCEWIATDTLEIAEMICLCENYFRTQFSRHKHTGGNLESLRIPMKDYIEYIKSNSQYQDNYPDKWVRVLINQLVSEAWIFGRESDQDGWTMKPFSSGCIGFPKNMDEHPAVMQTGSIDLLQYCTEKEQ